MSLVLPRVLLVPILAFTCLAFTLSNCLAQSLPNTNYGKFVHQPGDNQYEDRTQRERHIPPPKPQAIGSLGQAAASQAKPAWAPTPAPRLPDISIEPIVADEPIKPAGFPPLPDRPDIPVTSAWARAASGSAGGVSNAPAIANGGFNRSIQGVHEHYTHYMPGACIKQNEQAQSASQPSAGNAGGTHGYYKCSAPEAYNSNTGGGAIAKDKEPRLNPKLDTLQQAEAPTPVVVSQPATQELSSQDLSLPDDDYNAQNPSTRNGTTSRVARTLNNTATRALYNVTAPLMYAPSRLLIYH